MFRGKLGFALTLLLSALVDGLHFSGWFILWLLGLKSEPLLLNAWWKYIQALDMPQFTPFVGKIKLASGIDFDVPLLVWVILLSPLFKSKQESLHGDASFANMGGLSKSMLIQRTPKSLILGKYKGR